MRKLTGITVDMGNDDAPLDVDSALLQLMEELQAARRRRAAIALGRALEDIRHRCEQMDLQRPLIALTPDGERWKVAQANWTTGFLSLEPYRPD